MRITRLFPIKLDYHTRTKYTLNLGSMSGVTQDDKQKEFKLKVALL